ncbi:hypothetical protein BDR03DRAFT_995269 [Suillus americanus]|nr:hypothetical protein BDR03DRAFT_995269 [Suillus americanus]
MTRHKIKFEWISEKNKHLLHFSILIALKVFLPPPPQLMFKQLAGFSLPMEEVEKWATRINPDWRAKSPDRIMAGFVCVNQKVIRDHVTTFDGGPYLYLTDALSSSQDEVIIIYVTQGCHSRRKMNFERGEIECRAWDYLKKEDVDVTRLRFVSIMGVQDDLIYRRVAYR